MRRFKDGEVFAGKGVLCCKIETLNGIIAVYNTHVRFDLIICDMLFVIIFLNLAERWT